MSTYRALHEGWTLQTPSGPIPARVPGVVHTDLLAAGLIGDPYVGAAEAALSWIGRTTWRYATTFDWTPADGRHDLVCAGLDTLATVELNGVVLGRTADQHRPYRFDVGAVLRPGGNDLAVTFDSAIEYAERIDAEQHRPHVNPHPYNAIRKMACNFGWDWGPDLVTAGIWRPIGIESWHTARLAAVRPQSSADTITFDVQVTGAADRLTARVGDVSVTVDAPTGRVAVPVTLDGPALWWPRGHGGQPLYDAEVILSAGGAELDRWTGRVGFRTVALDTTGGAVTLRVNDRDVFVRGANWIPDDAFPSRVGRDRYARRLTDATDAGINLLRVWGGGIYASDDFYELCDERGVLVWQDFLFACAAYAEELLATEVEAEARAAVTRLAGHPSLVLWCGNNENLWGYVDWGWREELGDASWGAGFYHRLLPAIVADLDPGRPYIPGSPFSPDPAAHPNDPATGSVHLWDVWNTHDYRRYADHTPRFVAEFGFQGPPNLSTLTAAVPDLTLDSPVLLAHQKAEDGNGKLARGWRGHFPDPAGVDDWHWTTQLNQARAVTFGIERFRALAPFCGGTIVWQLNDCWPVISWAAVDGHGRRKPLWYALRRVYADRLVTVQPAPDGLAAVLVNDSAEEWTTVLRLRRLAFDGTELAARSTEVRVRARGTLAVPVEQSVATPGDPAGELLHADAGPRTCHFFAEDVDLALPRPEFTSAVHRIPDGWTVQVTADTLLRDLTLHADRLHPDATVDDQLVTLLPGEHVTFTVTSGAELDETAMCTAPVLRTANDLLHGIIGSGVDRERPR
jgi:beta-mannosidase